MDARCPTASQPPTGNPPPDQRREEDNDVDEEHGQQDAWDGSGAKGHADNDMRNEDGSHHDARRCVENETF